ncbi:MAG: PepSY-associated TM helix domain-containing protein [Cellvibrionales bacterium]|nr:PepSY-associated TM helix domain-containing protein [Cellvibrionales bacterium]
MLQATHKRLYTWHSVGALILSTLLIILCLTGIPIIFKKELQHYVLRGNTGELARNISIEDFHNKATQDFDLGKEEYHLTLGNPFTPHLIWLEEDGEHVGKTLIDGEFATLTALDAMDAIGHMHYNLLIPGPWGEYFVGLIGLLSLGMMFIGVLLHIKWRKEHTQFRPKRSFRLWASDLHKLTGFWLLPFHLVVTYTGATLGLGGLLIIMSAISSFEGDENAAIEAVLGKEPIASEQTCPQLPLSDLLNKSKQHWEQKYGGSEIDNLEVFFPGDCNAEVGIASKIPGYLLLTNFVQYSLVDGTLTKEIDWASSSFGGKWYATVGPLHYGHFASYFGKWIYVISALLLIVLIFSGLLLWVDKKQEKPLPNKLDYLFTHPLLKGSLAVTLSIVATSFSLLMLAKVWPNAFEHLGNTWWYLAFLSCGTVLVYVRPTITRWFLAFTILQMGLLIILDWAFSQGVGFFNGVNLSFFILSISLAMLMAYLKPTAKTHAKDTSPLLNT